MDSNRPGYLCKKHNTSYEICEGPILSAREDEAVGAAVESTNLSNALGLGFKLDFAFERKSIAIDYVVI